MTPDNPEVTMVWQPIESAPKDGNPFLAKLSAPNLRGDDGSMAVVSYQFERWIMGVSEETVWVIADEYLTHWMPLPPPPALSEGEKGGGE